MNSAGRQYIHDFNGDLRSAIYSEAVEKCGLAVAIPMPQFDVIMVVRYGRPAVYGFKQGALLTLHHEPSGEPQ